jgi:hypothetical protein
MHWRRVAALALTLALLTEAVAVIGGGTFMRSRIDSSERDYGARLVHWQRGLGLLATPSDWLLGIGAGRLPARYARDVPRGEFSGSAALFADSSGRNAVRLSGPATVGDYAGLFSLSQRITLQRGGLYRAGLKLRTASPITIALRACEQHLLYSRQCQEALLRVAAGDGGWQSVSVSLEGPELDQGHWYAPRLGLFSASILDTRCHRPNRRDHLDIARWHRAARQRPLLQRASALVPDAESYFRPGTSSNFYFESLIERGALGLAAVLALVGLALSNLYSQSVASSASAAARGLDLRLAARGAVSAASWMLLESRSCSC